MSLDKKLIEAKIQALFNEPKGKSKIICAIFSVLLGLSGILMIIGAIGMGSLLGLIGALIITPIFIAFPYFFYHFFKSMLLSAGNAEIRKEEFAKQIKGYHTLPFRKTYRGLAYYITAFILVITIIIGLATQNIEILYEIVIILPMMFLMRKGYSGIFILAIIWWSLEKGLQLYITSAGASIGSILVWWVVVAYVYFQAFLVERAFKKANIQTSEPKKHLWADISKALAMFVVLLVIMVVLSYFYGPGTFGIR